MINIRATVFVLGLMSLMASLNARTIKRKRLLTKAADCAPDTASAPKTPKTPKTPKMPKIPKMPSMPSFPAVPTPDCSPDDDMPTLPPIPVMPTPDCPSDNNMPSSPSQPATPTGGDDDDDAGGAEAAAPGAGAGAGASGNFANNMGRFIFAQGFVGGGLPVGSVVKVPFINGRL